MKLAQQHFAGPVPELTELAPWVLHDESRGPFQLSVTVVPPTDKFLKWQRNSLAKALGTFALGQAGDTSAYKKEVQKAAKRTPMELYAETAKSHGMVRELVIGMTQVFEDETEEELAVEEVDDLMAAPPLRTEVAWLYDSADYLEPSDVGGDAAWRELERNGEALATALVRFVQTLSEKATRQAAKNDEEEVLAPLASMKGSGRGKAPASTPIRSTSASDGSNGAAGAETAVRSGSPGNAAPAQVSTN